MSLSVCAEFIPDIRYLSYFHWEEPSWTLVRIRVIQIQYYQPTVQQLTIGLGDRDCRIHNTSFKILNQLQKSDKTVFLKKKKKTSLLSTY